MFRVGAQADPPGLRGLQPGLCLTALPAAFLGRGLEEQRVQSL